ncbi:DNA topoisomerase 3 [Ruminococcus bicirculans (ex Wegman et al. 2014)]|uniref:DNA topoisomerase 3 n=1 Tax=Ruminococcus bicirculans (ex Wegman et al. 2014) TaxID=1160721 RepID=UPI0016443C4A|nr:DNA topoisomerase 3 [Ruminococcus bicirculans (ex Wegman et al. 2014)]MBC3513583.1 DNA topoisomerase 3 [Ruminococcus bicirculans (ex Wegman et al. 2014)]
MAILIVGEKPSVSRAISSVVGANATKKGYTEGNGYIVSWCVGHLVGLKFPNDYGNGWNQKWSFSQLPMIPDNWLFQITDSTKAQYNLLKNLMNKDEVTEIICATDADREGECIFRYVYNMARCRKPVKRLWISSLEESAIRKALYNMKPMSAYDNLFNAGYARARADWLVGMNGSRLFSVRYGGKLNIGRVQTPTLAMIVQRDAEVNGFVKQKYYTADLNCGAFTLSSARIDDEKSADALVSACYGSTVTISSVKREVKTDKAPKLYDLTTLQREANKAFGYTAQQTLDYTQSLYEGKLVTYPRTDSRYLSDDMLQTALEVTKLCNIYFGFGISHTPDIKKVINNSKVSGHHAIIPTNSIVTADLSSLPTGEKNILTLIATKLICATAPAHKYEAVKLTGICNGTEFMAAGKTVLDMGWKRFIRQTDKEKPDEKALPAVSEGQSFTVAASKGEHFTSPPKPYTEDTLLSAMERAGNEDYDEYRLSADAHDTEKKGLGTPATRAATIEALVKNGYVERNGKQLRATDKGNELVTVIPDEVKSAKLTAEWESKLQQIEHGSLPETVFMSGIQQFIADMCRKYGSVDKSVSLSDGGNEPIGKCPKCGADVVKGKFGFYCKGKCGMNIAKVYGVGLSDAQVKGLLNGKSTSYTSKGRKTVVLPEIVENPYNGKMYYQWKTERSK